MPHPDTLSASDVARSLSIPRRRFAYLRLVRRAPTPARRGLFARYDPATVEAWFAVMTGR